MEPHMVDVNALSAALMGLTHKAVSSTPTTTYGHGPGGLFSSPALERPIFSAMVLPQEGLQSILPIRASAFDNPEYGLLTGVTATTGAEAEGPCDDPPVAGLAKLCTHTFRFGRQSRMSRVIELDRVGRLTSRGEYTDFQFVGGFANPTRANAPTMPGIGNTNNVINTEVGKILFELGVAWQRDFAREFYTGNPANNNPLGGRKYYYGLDMLINKGYRDAETGVACPAADSIVESFDNQNVADAGFALVRKIVSIYKRLRFIARGTGLDPAKWAIAMPWSMFYEITEIWPCAYMTYQCSVEGTNRNNSNTAELVRMRDDMRGDIYNRTGQYLLIGSERVPVILDDAITEDAIGGGEQRGSIYFVPLTVTGGTIVTYMEYLNYDMPNGAMEAARVLAPDGFYTTSDNGRFLWHRKPPTNFCVQMLAKSEPRLMVLTPQLGARLTGVQWTPDAHERTAFTDSAYFVNGGKTDRGAFAPSYYSPTA